jgi:hypothetical protein
MDLNLIKLLEKNESSITKEWFELVIATYPSDTSSFLKNAKDPFSNPVGSTTFKGLETLHKELLGNMDHAVITDALDPIIRIRAIQDFTPSQATGFIISLKKIIRKKLQKNLKGIEVINELLQFESKIDELSLIAFNIYMSCREKIYEIKGNEEKNRTFKAFERAGLITEITENPPSL